MGAVFFMTIAAPGIKTDSNAGGVARKHGRWQNAKAEPRRNSRFRPDIEGLRAIAVTAVVGYHAAIPILPGGFVGVDVFFVVSGFLITFLIMAEIRSTGGFSLSNFYAGRARRILPAAALVLTATGLASLALLPLLRVRDLSQDLVMAALQLSNWRFIQQGTNYLDAGRDPSPFLHFWSLAVEEQFYILWPVMIVTALAIARALRRRSSWLIAVALLALTMCSLWLSLRWTSSQPALAYMASPSRAWEFGLGGLLAVGSNQLMRLREHRSARIAFALMGWGGVGALVVSVYDFNDKTAFPGTAALVPTLGTAAIIASGSVAGVGAVTVGRLMAVRPLRAIGRLSYTWYLWHWPFIILFNAVYGAQTWQVMSLVALASAVAAFLTMRLVERPLRFSTAVSARPSSGLAIGLAATLIAVIGGLAVGTRATYALTNVSTSANSATLASVFNAATSSVNSGAVTPNPLVARTDRPQPDSCILQRTDTTGPACRFGSIAPGAPTVVLFGDSHAQQWQPAIQYLAQKRGWSLVVITKAGCPVADITPRKDGSNFSVPQCGQWRQASIDRIRNVLHPAMIVVSGLWNYIPDVGEMLTAWNHSLDQLRSAGAPIVYIADTPMPNSDIPVCISGHLSNWSACAFPRAKALRTDPVAVEALRGHEQHLTVLDFTNYLCPTASCPAVRSGNLLYRDDSHITASLSKIMAPAVAAELDKSGLMKPVKSA
jgi:peptidoglycan/LPS O-acetylase OafA/YrhL